MLELNFQYWLYSYLNLESRKTVFDWRINTTINQRHFHDPFYSIVINQNIIFGQNLVKKIKNAKLFLKMNLRKLPSNKHFEFSLSFFTLLKMPPAGIEPATTP